MLPDTAWMRSSRRLWGSNGLVFETNVRVCAAEGGHALALCHLWCQRPLGTRPGILKPMHSSIDSSWGGLLCFFLGNKRICVCYGPSIAATLDVRCGTARSL